MYKYTAPLSKVQYLVLPGYLAATIQVTELYRSQQTGKRERKRQVVPKQKQELRHPAIS